MSNDTITPFLKWPGGKRWLVADYDHLFYYEAKNYIEPFLGSAAVYFHIKPKSAILTDTNSDLISTYNMIRDDPICIIKCLERHQSLHSREYYYKIRGSRPQSEVTKAAKFIYLNRTCFNGLYRVNLKGVFNVPIGTKNKVILRDDNFQTISTILNTASIKHSDFIDIIALAGDGDFLYVDPPYTVNHNSNNFIKYNETLFSWSDQIRLSKATVNAAKRGARVMISNADHESIHDLYNNSIWSRMRVSRFSRLASSSIHRKYTTELIITNYLSNDGVKEDVRD